MEDGCRFWFENMFHLPDLCRVSMQLSYTFSSISVPYSVGEEKAFIKQLYTIKYDLVGGN